MPRFLSDEWSAQAMNALKGSAELASAAAEADLSVQQAITDAPGGPAAYWVKLSNGNVEGGPGETDSPDVTITQDYETAVAITRGDLVAQAAFMQGKLKITGNMGKLLQHQKVLDAVFPVLGGLDTEY